jgi:regulator of PEP synthase PpsR (kinase-PPPase family)
MHAVVSPKHKQQVETFCRTHRLACCDMTGAFVDFLASASGTQPRQDVGALHEVSDEYHRRIEAIEFTMQHDDGLGVTRLQEADVVLVGVSRTSKTPTCIYLAQQGYKAANVAIAIEVPLPEELLSMKEKKIVGLLIDPVRLVEVRQTRQRDWHMAGTSYTNYEHVESEVTWSRHLFNRQGWPTLDVTKTAVEETAARVIHVLNLGPK